jgi:Sec-independent protein translocase protein TatA|tara:strand:- start:59 stop:214 length:156 start_codon:yes stop_codon:yes gene_type:complete
MGNFSFGQLIILFLLFLLVFGDFSKLLANLKTVLKKQKYIITKKKNRKKGS